MAAKLKLVLSESDVNIVNNTSKVTAKLYYYGNGVSHNYNNPKGTITIDGTSYSFSHDFTTSTSAQLLATKSKTVTHNSDGTKTVSVSASFKTGVSLGTMKTSASLVLTAIPRASDIALDKTTVLANGKEAVVATVTKKVDTYTDELLVSLGEYSQPIEAGVAFVIPEEWINAITGTKATAKVTVTTYSEDVVIGTNTADLEVQVPDEIVPVVNGVTVTEAVAKVTEAFGNLFVQNLSQLNVDVDAAGVYGSEITSYSVTLDGVTYIQKAFTTNVINTYGTLVGTVTVVDSRGRTAADTFTVNIIEYQKPAVASITYYYCDNDGNRDSTGTNTKIIIDYKAYPVEGQNSKSILLSYKSMADETATERIITLDEWEGTVEAIIYGADYSMTYKYTASLTDKIETSASAEATTGVVVISRMAGGKGVTFFGEAEEDGLIIKGKNPLLFKDSEALEATKQHLGIGADYIVEEGTNEYGSYRKWKGGKAEVWYTMSGNATTDKVWSSPIYYTDYASFANCFNDVCNGIFAEQPKNVTMTSTSSQFFAIYPVSISANGFPSLRFLSVAAKTNTVYRFSVYAVGTWAENGEETTLTATHDGAGNVTAYGITATHDGAGNVRIL